MNFPKTTSHFIIVLTCLAGNLSLPAQNDLQQLNQYFYHYELAEIHTTDLVDQIREAPADDIHIRLLDRDMFLKRSDILSDNYRCMVAGDFETYLFTDTPAVPMNGYSSRGERVSLTIGHEFIQGFVQTENGLFYIEPVYHFVKEHDSGWYVVYDTREIIPGKELTCGVNESHRMRRSHPAPTHDERMVDECYRVQYAIATDYLMYNHYGSVAAVQNHNIAVTNDMQTNYDDEFADEIQFVIVQQYIVTSAGSDPFTTSTDSGDLLDSFTAWAPAGFSATHDLGTLWTKRNLDGSTIGLAWVGSVCSSVRYNICEDFSMDANQKRVLLAHEIGHNFDAVHDASGNYIMLPTVGNYINWSPQSITDIQAYYMSSEAACLDDCVGTTPTIAFNAPTGSTGETGETPSGPVCTSPYKTFIIPVSLSLMSPLQNVVAVNILGSGTATAGLDFILNTATLTFPPNTASTQYIQLQIINDAVEEVSETIVLGLSMISGPAVIGANAVHTLNLFDGLDIVSTACCSPGGYTAYGSNNTSVPFIFTSFYEDGRSRFLYLASQLTAAGITSGYLTGIAFYTLVKFSTFPFQNFRIGMSNVTMTTLLSQPWISSEQVFLGTVSTVQASWVTIDFNTPFYWDGTSNLYFEFCFDNTVKTNNSDYIYTTNPVGGGNGKYNEAYVNNGTNGCNLGAGDIIVNYNNQSYQPHFRFYKLGGAKIETAVTGTVVSHIKSGETGHFYSANDKVIASIKNIGPTDIECTTVQVSTSGTTKPNLPFGGGQYAAKTYQVTADENSLYEITMYYTQAELSTWGADAGRLNIIKSSTPLASSTLPGVEIIRPDSVYSAFGPDNAYVYKGTFSGFSYFSLTNRNIPVGSVLGSGDLVFLQSGKGTLLQNKSGGQYALSVNNAGAIQLNSSPMANYSSSLDNDLVLSQIGQGVVLRAPNNSFWKLSVSNTGVVSTNTVSPLTTARVENVSENMLINKAGGSFILKSPDGKCWRVFIKETGGLRTVNVLCP